MTSSAANPMDAVAVLMKERQRIEEWISQLESRRSITPPHVFERVRGDYEARLQDVLQKLAGRTTEVQATQAALTERLARLQTEETSIRDARYEAELRSHVGEITQAQWTQIERESDERIAKIGNERTSVIGEIARLQQLLAMSAAPAPAAPAAPAAAPAEQRSSAPVPRPPSFDELEFLKSVTDGARSGAFPKFNGQPPARTSKPVEAPRTSSPVEAPRNSRGVPRAATPAAAPAVPAAPAASSAPAPAPARPSAPTTRRSDPVPAPAPTDGLPLISPDAEPAAPEKTPEPVPAFLRDVPQEEKKTLRCHDCGTMNLPTEWYCERCGGELAAM